MRVEKRLLSLLLCLAILAAGCGLAALAEGGAVSYISYSWNGATNTLTSTSGTITNYTVLTGREARLTTGWYVARGTLTYEGRLTVSGDVYLILEDDCKVIAKQGIDVSMERAPGSGGIDPAPNTLAIYAQSEGLNMGRLEAEPAGNNAAIGGAGGKVGGLVTIYGGSVSASTTGDGAGIGGGDSGTGTVTIYGGSVTASATSSGAAIGCGHNGAGTVTIYGGSVTASATGVGPAIGSNNCVVSLGLTGNADYVYADNYRSKGDTIRITTRLRVADMAEIYDSDVSVNTIAGKLLIPDTDDAATLHGWPAKADFTLPAGLTELGANAFEGIAATTVLVPAGVTTVGANAFSDSDMKKIRFLGEHTIVDATAFADCGSITAFAIPCTDTWMSLEGVPNITLLPMT